MGIFSAKFAMLCYDFHVVKWGLSPGFDSILCRNGLILRRNGFPLIINDDFLEEGGGVTADNSTLRIAYRFISNL